MGRPPAVTDYSSATDAKHLLDQIGETVQKEVHSEALSRSESALKGFLTSVVYQNDERSTKSTPPNPCDLEHSLHTNVTDGHSNPCEGRAEDRFSDTQGAQCHTKKIKDSDSNGGACAPFRRLHLCDQHLSHMKEDKINTKDNLLLEVCLAAKYEGDSLRKHHDQYKINNKDSQLCTVLARSFADIGDIVRGRDLYRGGNTKEKDRRDKLEDNLKRIFQQIHSGLSNGAKDRYNGDKENFYQLREDWWELNRLEVWKAITCNAWGNTYFRGTCSKDTASAKNNCQCIDQTVPTYFDYVPQYLRWFEEWAEDFCRKKKKKVENLQKQCRGQDKEGADRYCSRNGFDCEKTIRKIELLRMGKGCTDCFFACNPYVEWIDNQRKQFDKQKNKYEKEMQKYTNGESRSGSGGRRLRRSEPKENYEGYEKKFYNILKNSSYSGVDAFLEKLNNETDCQNVDDPQGGIINFEKVNTGGTAGSASVPGGGTSGTNDKEKGTFYRSDYCQPCPICGVKKTREGKFEEKSEKDKCNIKLYKPKSEAKGTPINFLYSGDETNEIGKKLKAFCDQTSGSSVVGSSSARGNGVVASVASGGNSGRQELYEEWKCYEIDELTTDGQEGEDDHYYEEDVRTGGGLCILEKTNGEENGKKQKTFNPFFYYWVAHMLKDSIYWETQELKKCLKNEKKKCGNPKCEKSCKCFETWIKQKKEKEWDPIKTHFKKQKNLGLFTHDALLKQVLELEFANKNTEEDKKNNVSAREIHLINEMLKEDEKEQEATGASSGENNTTIDKLLKHEEGIATKCKKCEDPPQRDNSSVARSDSGPRDTTSSPVNDAEDEDEEEEEEDEVEEAEEGTEEPAKDSATTKQGEEETEAEPVPEEGEGPTTQNDVNVCQIVANILTKDNLKEACQQKYDGKYYGWKCVTPSGTTSEATGEGSAEAKDRHKREAPSSPSGSSEKGSICVPPRRRRLYVKKLHDWASGGNTQASETTQGQTPSQSDKLLKAFVESAAVETFFLWHKYKVDKAREDKERKERENEKVIVTSHVGEELQKKLEGGKIDDEFKRQMFYTLGDYRDIFEGKSIEVGDTSEDTKMKEIQNKIQEYINSVSKPSGDKDPKDWWNENAKHIWKGMICAL
ncbi:hypothetical protein PFTANZ_06295, partial [Plasmodium falciparum Tanzania (2000708)]